MRPAHGLCGAAGNGKALGKSRLQVSGEAQKEAKLVGSTAGQKDEGASGNWLEELGVCVCVGRAARSGRRSWR